MTEFVLPDFKDVKAVIADYFDTLAPDVETSNEREQIIANCEKPFVLLMSAWKIVDSRGNVEKQILYAFIKDVAFQNG